MIPVLYDSAETTFTNCGIGLLRDCLECTVAEERNGAFELYIKYPINGRYFDELTTQRIIKAKPNDMDNEQLFIIYKIERELSGICGVYAEHYSYLLNNDVASAGTYTGTAGQVIQNLCNNGVLGLGFTATTDITTTNTVTVTEPYSIRGLFFDKEGSVLDVFGGEYRFDNSNITLYSHRGCNRGLILQYGKNLTDLSQDTAIDETYTGIYPYYKKTENGIETVYTLPEKVLYCENHSNFAKENILARDFSSDFEEGAEQSINLLRQLAQSYINDTKNKFGVPSVSLDVKFKDLSKILDTNQAKVNICDYVTIVFEKLGVDATAEIVKVEYDVLMEKFNSISLGEAKQNLAVSTLQTLKTVSNEASAANSNSIIALNTASTADTKAGEALGTANIANSTANEALGTANEALGTANIALNTASDVGGTADAALTKANEALTETNDLDERVATLEDTDEFLKAYPIGSIYTKTSNVPPATGTWILVGSGTIGSTTGYYWERTA